MKKSFTIAAFIALAILALYSINRAALGHSIPDEKRYLQSTKEMIASGDYVTPRYHGKLRFQKPIFFYWLILLSYKIFGVTIFGARFPSIMAGLLNVIIAFLTARVLFNKKTAVFSALILATGEVFFMYSRFAVPDMVFSLFINTSLCAFAAAYTGDLKGEFRYLYIYVFMALAVITKGPLGLIFPLAAISVFLGIRRGRSVLRDMKIVPGLLLFMAISAPWFIAMIALHGNEYIGNVWSLEIVKKLNLSSSGGPRALIRYFGSIFYYLGMVFARNLPWSVFLPAAAAAVPYYRDEKRSLGFLLSWFFAIFTVLILIWSRESYYVLPLSMPLAIFIGLYFAALTEKNVLADKFLFKWPFVIVIVFMFFALIGWLFFTSYGLGRPVGLPSLLMFLPIGFLVYASTRREKKILIPASLIVAAFAFFAYFGACVISVVDDEPLVSFAEGIKSVIKDGDLIAASSSGAGYHRLNVYLDEYEVLNINSFSAEAATDGKKDGPLDKFLSQKDVRVFCVMSKDDYERRTSEKTKESVYIMAGAFKWRRFEKEGSGYFMKMLSYLLRNERDLFRSSLKDEIYLVSNMP